MHHSEHRKRRYAQHQQDRDYEAPLFHYETEYEVGIGRSYVFERAVAGSETQHAAARAKGHGSCLLVSEVVHEFRFPDVAPGIESRCYVWLEPQNDKPHRAGSNGRESETRDISASEERNDQVSRKEYERRSEVAHHRKTAKAEEREQRVHHGVLSVVKLLKSAGAYEYESQLDQFGRLYG